MENNMSEEASTY